MQICPLVTTSEGFDGGTNSSWKLVTEGVPWGFWAICLSCSCFQQGLTPHNLQRLCDCLWEKSYVVSLTYSFFHPEIYDTADEHIMIMAKVPARNSVSVMAVVDKGPQLDSYEFYNQILCKLCEHITSSTAYSQHNCITRSVSTTSSKDIKHVDFREARCFVKHNLKDIEDLIWMIEKKGMLKSQQPII